MGKGQICRLCKHNNDDRASIHSWLLHQHLSQDRCDEYVWHLQDVRSHWSCGCWDSLHFSSGFTSRLPRRPFVLSRREVTCSHEQHHYTSSLVIILRRVKMFTSNLDLLLYFGSVVLYISKFCLPHRKTLNPYPALR